MINILKNCWTCKKWAKVNRNQQKLNPRLENNNPKGARASRVPPWDCWFQIRVSIFVDFWCVLLFFVARGLGLHIFSHFRHLFLFTCFFTFDLFFQKPWTLRQFGNLMPNLGPSGCQFSPNARVYRGSKASLTTRLR